MALKLYNTLSRTKEEFVPIDPNNVRMYVCGPTVYDFAHIGNARPVIVFDVLFRLLRHIYGESHVTYVRNITDIDDKINLRALELATGKNISIEMARAEITAATAKQYEDDVAALGAAQPTRTPRATEHVPQMVAMIETLIANGHAYVVEGHVLFDVSSKSDYGKLSRQSPDEMIAGSRVEVAPYKRGPMDFVLWKPSDAETPGWDSRWGRGRPGWHIECSAMSAQYLGETFDIHGGGIDLRFPHHENEIAQSESAHLNHPLAKVWMHNGFLNVEGEKMSKSLGNFVTINDLLSTKAFGERSWPGHALRLCMLGTHYRQPLDWTLRALQSAFDELTEWSNIISASDHVNSLILQRASGRHPQPAETVLAALSDDLNTPAAITALRGVFQRFVKGDESAAVEFIESCEFLGFMNIHRIFEHSDCFVRTGERLLPQDLRPEVVEVQTAFANSDQRQLSAALTTAAQKGVIVRYTENGLFEYEVLPQVVTIDVWEIQRLIDLRTVAKKQKNFSEADRIRTQLDSEGIVLKDDPSGTTWEVKR